MAERDYTIRTEKRWPLLEQLPRGPVREKLSQLKHELEKIDHAANTLTTLAYFERLCEQETVTLAVQTVISVGCYIETAVNTVFGCLDQVLAKEAESEQSPRRQAQENET